MSGNHHNGGRRPQLDERVAQVEATLIHFGHELNTNRDKFEKQLDDIDTRFSGKLETIEQAINNSNKTPWANIWAALAVLIAIIGAAAAPVLIRLSENRETGLENREKIQANEINIAVLTERLTNTIHNFEQHAAAGNHPWGILQRMQKGEGELSAVQAKQFTAAEGARLQAQIEALKRELEHRHQHDH